MTTREKAERLLQEIPEERVPAALEALEAVIWGDGVDNDLEAILDADADELLDELDAEERKAGLGPPKA
jgi:hypothetical protein